MGKHALTVVVAVIIAVSLLLYMFTYTVRTSEQAVVLRFGKPLPILPKAGFHFKWPWPIEDVRTFDNRLQASEGTFTEEMYTNDRHNIITSVFVGWKIADPLKFNENFGRNEEPSKQAWVNLQSIVRHHTSSTLGQHKLNEFVCVDQEPRYAAIEEEIQNAAAKEAVQTYGISIEIVKIKRLELPESVMAKVHERMKSERNLEATKIKQDGETVAEVIRRNAESARDQILSVAQREVESIRSQGDAAAAAQFDIFAKYPELAIYLREIRALREAMKEKSTIIVDTTVPPFNVLVKTPPQVKAAQSAREKVAAAESHPAQ